jgi:Tol biopolymer transport system component
LTRTTWALIALLAAWPARAQEPVRKAGSPADHLPPQITQLAAFGERPAWSPDGRRIAFIGKSYGDAFEIDLRTRLIRLLTGHFTHAGFLRIQFLPNGDYFLIGARTFTDIKTTRDRDEEMWIMSADGTHPPVALDHKIFEGVAISRLRERIAWTNNHGQYPDLIPEGESVMYVADIAYLNGIPRLVNKKEVLRTQRAACSLEAQDFRFDDRELIYTCYRQNGTKADVYGLELATGKVTPYRALESEYNEAEGVSPDGRWVLVESSKDQGSDRQTFHYIDLWRLPLVPNPKTFVRMTHFGDYEGFKASNPVVSNDGRWFAFQAGRSTDPAGVGYGIFVYRLGR